MKKSYIYRIDIDDKYYYGSTRDIEKRRWHHICGLRGGYHDNIHIQRAYDKYGDFDMYPVFVCSPEEQFDIEQSYINVFIKNPKCMNINPDAANPPSFKGKKHKEETKEKIRKKAMGHKRTIDKTIYTFVHEDGIAVECTADDLVTTQKGLDRSTLWKLIHGKQEQHKGWRVIK
jgi:group I intron endonuclease